MNRLIPPTILAAARNLVERRLGIRLAAHQDANLASALHDHFVRHPGVDPDRALERLAVDYVGGPDWQRIVARITVGETSFFRHREWFAAIETEILAPLIAARRDEGRRTLALWSIGCATGEEPYTLAMILSRMLSGAGDWALTIQASDINGAALEHARRGLYRDWSMREVDEATRDRHFVQRRDKRFQLNADIRGMVRFDVMNIADPVWASAVPDGFDLIVCRNVLMYFPSDTQRRIAARLANALAPGGWIAVSPAEAGAEMFRPLRVVNRPDAILFRRDPQGLAVPAPREPSAPERRIDVPPMPKRSRSQGQPAASRLEPARRLADEGRHDEARALCDAALRAEPLCAEGYALLATIHAESGDLDAAIQATRQGLYLKPGCPDIAFLQAGLLMRSGRREPALRMMRQVLKDLEGVPDMEIVRPVEGMTARAMRELVRSSLAVTELGEDSDDKAIFPRP